MPESLLMTMSDSYYGAYGDAATRDKTSWFIFDWFECKNCTHSTCGDACSRWASIPFQEIGGFLFEPGSSSGLVRFPPTQLITAITERIQENNGLLMVNEVTTGIGRTGAWFGFQHYGIQPDIVALGKGIGNGYPVSVTSMNAQTVQLLGNVPIPYGQSHLNDPLGAAVAQAVINHIAENDLITKAEKLSSTLLGGLHRIAKISPHIASIRGRGLMAVIELGQDPDNTRAARLHRQLIDKGFILVLRPGSSILRIDPPLTIEEQDIVRFLEMLEQLLSDF